jgi:hypothetical protein
MDPTTVLKTIRIASPCHASWADMSGDDRVRHCSLCRKTVYNLSALPADEAAALVVRTEGKICGRFYRRRDGTILTADCPVGAGIAARGRLRRLTGCALTGVLVVLSGALARGSGGSGLRMHWEPPPSGPGVTLADWSDWALDVLGIRTRPMTMGFICVPTVPTPSAQLPSPPDTPLP